MKFSIINPFARRKKLTIVFSIFLIVQTFLIYSYFFDDDTSTSTSTSTTTSTTATTIKDAINDLYTKSEQYLSQHLAADNFYQKFFQLVITNSPQDEIQLKGENLCSLNTIGVNSGNDQFYSYEQLLECFKIDNNSFKSLQKYHRNFINRLPANFLPGFYSGNGIVIVGGGKFSLLAALSIKTLRYTGSQLPVEVFIPQDDIEQDPGVCQLFETMNAKCIYLTDLVDKSTIKNLKVTGYQLKILAILASSFENVLLLDADNNVMSSGIDRVFDAQPFNETGLVTWPDYWKRATSPYFYQIADLEIGPLVRNNIDDISAVVPSDGLNLDADVSYHDRANTIPDGSTESGQMLINKYKHAKTLMLSFYYNYNGPQAYYQLLGQGTSGEGDKDTFLAAAQVLQKPFYQIKQGPGTEGYHTAHEFHGVCMLHANPMLDYQQYSKITPEQDLDIGVGFDKIDKNIDPDFYFLHAHHPKLDPYGLYQEGTMVEETEQGTKKHRRMYSNLSKYGIKFDFELLEMKLMLEMFCGENDLKFNYVVEQQHNNNREQVCQFVKEHHDFLLETSEGFGGI